MTNFNFMTLKTPPPKKKGYLVIQSDDGYRADYTHWFQLFLRKNQEYNSWAMNIVPFSPAINSSRINGASGMTVDNLKEILRTGGEIVSHGKFHMGLIPHIVTLDVQSGSTSFEISDAGRVFGYPQSYVINGGGNEEIITITNRDNVNSSAKGFITLAQPVQNSYPANSSLRATEETSHNEWQGLIDDVTAWGIECKNHVWPYNQNDQLMRDRVKSYFDSARGEANPPVNEPGVDLFNLKSRNINGMTISALDSLLQELSTKNAVGIIYGHAEKSSATLDKLEHVIDECVRLGIEIITHQRAIELLR